MKIYSRNRVLVIALLIGVIMIALFGISQVLYLKKAHSTFENYYAFRGCVRLLERTGEYGTCKLSDGKIIKIVEFKDNWYLDGDLPCGFLCF